MHPAWSIILFTVLSGVACGLLAALGLTVLAHPDGTPGLRLTVLLFALSLLAAGLMASSFHLGRPERAWRAFSQWRSSWLSREGIAALLLFPSALALAGAILWPDRLGWLGWLAGPLTAVTAVATVHCTAMIYASLKPIRQWHTPLAIAGYHAMAWATGLSWLLALAHCFAVTAPALSAAGVAALAGAWAVKRRYWRRIDSLKAPSTPQTAIGLFAARTVSALDPPHTEENYLQREMGFAIARRHAARLRATAEVVGFALPIALLVFAFAVGGLLAAITGLVAALAASLGALIERWLFFAEATHTVTLYYGAQTV